MLQKALATFVVAIILLSSGLARASKIEIHRYCCAPKHNPYLRIAHKHKQSNLQMVLGRIVNVRFLQRFTKLGEFRLTAYTGDDPGQGTGRYTSSGKVARYGLVAVPSWIPLGTYLYIVGYGLALAADHGGAVQGNHIDLCFGRGRPGSSAYHMAQNWGTRYGNVYRVPAGFIR